MKGKNKIITSFPLILFFMSCCFSMNLWAQEATIRGSVKDTDGEPIESVALYFVLEAKGISPKILTYTHQLHLGYSNVTPSSLASEDRNGYQ